MTESKSQERFEAAVELKFLDPEQLEAIKLEQNASNGASLDIAIRKGFLNRRQLDLLDVLADPMSVVPGYRIDGFLGRGGVGTVYKATQLRMDRPVAIKTINRASARNDLTPKRFEREAKILGRLRHPNIIPAFDFGIHNEQLYLVMEFVDGIDAEQLLTKQIRLPEFHAWHIAQQVCHALDNAKQHDVIHRDIKPGNLILTVAPAGTKLPAGVPFVQVADFGLAKFNSKQLDATITLDQAVSGTPFYMSCEQIKAEPIDHRSDIYSLGTTIWHLITGSPPIDGTGPLDVITRKMKLEDQWLDETPDSISNAGFQLLKKMCRHDREQRIADYASLNREIESVIDRLAQDAPSHAGTSAQENDFELVETPCALSAKVLTMHELAKTYMDDSDLNAGEATQDLVSSGPITPEVLAQPQHPERLESAASENGLRFYHWFAIAIGAIVLSVAISWLLPTGQALDSNNDGSKEVATPGDQSTRSFVRLSEFSGLPIILFNGRNLDPTQKFTGTWEPAEDPVEGGAILSGNGTRNFCCRDTTRKPLQYFRFVCGFRHNAAKTIVFRLLDESEVDESKNTLWEVNIQPDEATLVDGSTTSICPVQQFDEKTNFGYHEFRIESQPDHWRIEIDDALLGEIPKRNEDFGNEHTVQLSVTGGEPAHFEQIRFRSLSGN